MDTNGLKDKDVCNTPLQLETRNSELETAEAEVYMGLIDDIRKKRDSWMARFEEHRQDEDDEERPHDRAKENEEVLRNRKMVGVFPKKEEIE